jgi:hypothetical protein
MSRYSPLFPPISPYFPLFPMYLLLGGVKLGSRLGDRRAALMLRLIAIQQKPVPTTDPPALTLSRSEHYAIITSIIQIPSLAR